MEGAVNLPYSGVVTYRRGSSVQLNSTLMMEMAKMTKNDIHHSAKL
jgi:hypothetical protein